MHGEGRWLALRSEARWCGGVVHSETRWPVVHSESRWHGDVVHSESRGGDVFICIITFLLKCLFI